MSYKTLKALRTKIGAALDDRQLIGDTSQGELKQLYGALSDDMTLAAAKAGPEALKAADRASKFWGAGRSRIDDVLTPVVNKKLSQDIFQAAMSGAKSGSQKLRALKKSLPKNEWDAVVAQQIKEMGLAKAGVQDVTGEVFSPASFLTSSTAATPSTPGFNTITLSAKLDPPVNIPIIGIIIILTKPLTTAPTAPASITAIAKSTTLPVIIKFLNSFNIFLIFNG